MEIKLLWKKHDDKSFLWGLDFFFLFLPCPQKTVYWLRAFWIFNSLILTYKGKINIRLQGSASTFRYISSLQFKSEIVHNPSKTKKKLDT